MIVTSESQCEAKVITISLNNQKLLIFFIVKVGYLQFHQNANNEFSETEGVHGLFPIYILKFCMIAKDRRKVTTDCEFVPVGLIKADGSLRHMFLFNNGTN